VSTTVSAIIGDAPSQDWGTV